MQTQIDNVIKWGHDKGILGKDGKGTLKGQSKKMIEEANETLVAVTEYNTIRQYIADNNYNMFAASKDEVKDGIGDIMVTLILLADMLNITLEECLVYAYIQIADRKGKMVDGTFVKDK